MYSQSCCNSGSEEEAEIFRVFNIIEIKLLYRNLFVEACGPSDHICTFSTLGIEERACSTAEVGGVSVMDLVSLAHRVLLTKLSALHVGIDLVSHKLFTSIFAGIACNIVLLWKFAKSVVAFVLSAIAIGCMGVIECAVTDANIVFKAV